MPRGSGVDAVGNVTRLTVTPATTTTILLDIAYAYNDLSQMVSLTSDGKTTTYAYEPGCASCGGGGGNLTTITRPNGIVTSMTYDRASQVTGIKHNRGNGPALSCFFYTYDSARNRATMRDVTGQWTYTYDKLNRLVNASATIWPELGYEYDAGGNRVGATNPMSFAAPEVYGYNADDELTDLIGGGDAATTIHYEWDPRGNLASRDVLAGAGSGLACTFDGWERLTKAVSPSATKYFGYDASGERVEEVTGVGSGATRRWFIYEGLNVVMELNGAGWPTAVVVPGLSKTRLDLPEPFTEYFLHDALGSVAELTDSQGNLTQEYWYEPFGNAEYAPRRDPHNRYRFVGLQQDDDLGLIYMNARWYDPAVGRFMSRDPVEAIIREVGSLNPYVYVRNNPETRIDPSGLWGMPWEQDFPNPLARFKRDLENLFRGSGSDGYWASGKFMRVAGECTAGFFAHPLEIGLLTAHLGLLGLEHAHGARKGLLSMLHLKDTWTIGGLALPTAAILKGASVALWTFTIGSLTVDCSFAVAEGAIEAGASKR